MYQGLNEYAFLNRSSIHIVKEKILFNQVVNFHRNGSGF